MRLFFSIISHLHHDIIINLNTLKTLSNIDNIEVICRDNLPMKKLKHYCEKYNISYLANEKKQGFSANNNANYLFCKNELGMQEDDYFILLNPDVFISSENIEQLIFQLENEKITLATVNLFLDREEMVHDDNIRVYPKFSNFVKTYLLNDRSTMINRYQGLPKKYWASCSFMVINAGVYNELNGLDERYYMYCEDIDFCYRANKLGHIIHYLEKVKAVHFRRRASKRFLSKYFIWHVHSVFKYSFINKRIKARKSQLNSQAHHNDG